MSTQYQVSDGGTVNDEGNSEVQVGEYGVWAQTFGEGGGGEDPPPEDPPAETGFSRGGVAGLSGLSGLSGVF